MLMTRSRESLTWQKTWVWGAMLKKFWSVQYSLKTFYPGFLYSAWVVRMVCKVYYYTHNDNTVLKGTVESSVFILVASTPNQAIKQLDYILRDSWASDNFSVQSLRKRCDWRLTRQTSDPLADWSCLLRQTPTSLFRLRWRAKWTNSRTV